MPDKFRVSIGLNLKKFGAMERSVFETMCLQPDELKSLTIVRATAILYTNRPYSLMRRMAEWSFEFNWINISKE